MTSGHWWFRLGMTRFVVSSYTTRLLRQYAYELHAYELRMRYELS